MEVDEKATESIATDLIRVGRLFQFFPCLLNPLNSRYEPCVKQICGIDARVF